MASNRVKSSVALVVILAAAAGLVLTLVPFPPGPNTALHEMLGRETAQEAVKLASGGKIVLIAPDTGTFPNKAFETQVKAFQRAVKASGGHLVLTNLVKLDRLRLVRAPPASFSDGFRKISEADVVVSFLGPPLFTPEQRAKLPAKLPRVLAVCSGDTARQVPMKALFESGLLHEAIISRPDARPSASGPVAFTQLFQVITSANLADLPPPSSTATFQ